MPLSLLSWLRWTVDCRQRLEVDRHRLAIPRRKLRGVADHRRHAAADRIAVGHLAGFEQICDVLHGIVGETLLSNVGHPAFAFQVRPASEALRGLDRAQGIARAVTLGAVTGSVDQIGATVPFSRLRRIRSELLAVEKQELSTAEGAADIERKWHVVIAHLALNGRQRL